MDRPVCSSAVCWPIWVASTKPCRYGTKRHSSTRGSIAWRNLGLVAAAKNDLKGAEQYFRRAIAARPDDQTLYRDLAEILIADGRRADGD